MSDPINILTDFSLAQINALKFCFSSSQISGCYFHLVQALNKKMKSKTKLPLDQRKILLSKIKDQIKNQKKSEITPLLFGHKLDDFKKYFIKTWENRFPPPLWDHHYRSPSILPYSTNNLVEREFRSVKLAIGTHSKVHHVIEKLFLYHTAKEDSLKKKVINILFLINCN